MNLLPFLFLLAPNPKYIDEALARWEPADLDVTVVSRKCGYLNASYDPNTHVVEMCTEMYKDPQMAVYVFNHEMGHALMHQRYIPNSERGADELGFLMSSDEEALAATRWFLARGGTESEDGDHPADLDRAAQLLCLIDGRDPDSDNRVCRSYEASVEENWARMLIMTDPTAP